MREEVAFFHGVLTKRDIGAHRKTNDERELAIRRIVSSAVVSKEVVDIFDAVGLDDSVRARLRLMVKRILCKSKYPPDAQVAAVELVLTQARALGEEWVA